MRTIRYEQKKKKKIEVEEKWDCYYRETFQTEEIH
jgi:hypothetical protein